MHRGFSVRKPKPDAARSRRMTTDPQRTGTPRLALSQQEAAHKETLTLLKQAGADFHLIQFHFDLSTSWFMPPAEAGRTQ